jgi:hypothetical protein
LPASLGCNYTTIITPLRGAAKSPPSSAADDTPPTHHI